MCATMCGSGYQHPPETVGPLHDAHRTAHAAQHAREHATRERAEPRTSVHVHSLEHKSIPTHGRPRYTHPRQCAGEIKGSPPRQSISLSGQRYACMFVTAARMPVERTSGGSSSSRSSSNSARHHTERHTHMHMLLARHGSSRVCLQGAYTICE